MGQRYGSADRDRLWSHPDLLPTSDDLDEPMDFVARHGLDDELAALSADDAAQPQDVVRPDESGDGEQPEH
jgi:hypothetical protein